MISVFELFKVWHRSFVVAYSRPDEGRGGLRRRPVKRRALWRASRRFSVTLYGSLAFTGKGPRRRQVR